MGNLTNDSSSPIFSHFPSILRYLPNCKQTLNISLQLSIELSLLVPSTILVLWQGYLFCLEIWFASISYALFWVVSIHFSVSSNNITTYLTHFNQFSEF